MNAIRWIALRALGIAHLGRDINLLDASLLRLNRRVTDLEARVAEFTVGEPASQERRS